MAVINKQMKTFNVPAGSDVKRYEIVDDAGRKMIAADWYENSGSAFASGAYIVKDGVVYEFISNHAENTAWNTNEVRATTITAKIAAIEAGLEDKADKSATVSNVAYDTTNKKITKTVNGTTTDVVTAEGLKTDMNLGNVDNTSDLDKPVSTATQTALNAKLDKSQKGVAGGVAELDATGKVPASQLPGYVDDIVNGYLYEGAFYKDDQHTQLITPEDDKLYVELVSNKTYRWSGTAYIEVSESLALGETSSTAYRGDRGKAAYDHAVAKGAAFASGLYKITTNGEGHVTGATPADKSDIGLGNVDNTSDVNKPVSTAMQTALDAKLNNSQKGAAGGVAELDANGKVPTSQLPASTDTKNTAGATDNPNKKMYLVGAETQGANPQTYSNDDVYIGTDNELYSNGKKVAHNEDIPTVGAAAAKGVDTTITEGSTSTNLPTSAAVAAYVDEHGGGGDAVGSYYGESSTAAATQQKDVTVSGTAPTELAVGMVFNIKFTNAQTYAGKPTLKIGTLAAVSVDNGSAGMWGAGEVVCFVYDGTNFMATDTGTASTSGYGVTKLQDGTSSTATDLAATANAVNTVHNEAVQVMTGATDQLAGTSGRVPAPAIADKKKFLCGDGTWAEAEGGKLVVFELDTVTNSGGSYTHTTSIATVSHDMKAVLIETDDPSIFGATVHVTTADGAITLTCDEVNGTADITVSCMFVANADPMTSSEFDVLSNRIGQLSALTTTDKSSVVGAVNEVNASLPTNRGRINRWLRFDPTNKKGLVIKAGTTLIRANGSPVYFAADTAFDLTANLGQAGKDYGVYLLNDGTITAALLTSAPANSVKIGRFHTLCANVGTITNMQIAMSPSCGYAVGDNVLVKPYRQDEDPDFYAFYNKTITAVTVQDKYDVVACHHPLSGFEAGDILPESIFCLSWFPDTLYEDAMAYDKETDIPIDIYLQSGTGLNTRSAYNATHTVSREEINHTRDLMTVGKRPLTDHEFTAAALGSNERTNITGSSDKTYVGGHMDTSNRRMISAIGIEEMCGYLWQWLDEIGDVGGTDWKPYDSHASFGQSYGIIPYCLLGGGIWGDSSYCGSRSRNAGDPRSAVNTYFGGRGASRMCYGKRST